jgi:hypothetical protein
LRCKYSRGERRRKAPEFRLKSNVGITSVKRRYFIGGWGGAWCQLLGHRLQFI